MVVAVPFLKLPMNRRKGERTPFSTGGAYAYVPANLDVNVETEGIVKLQMKNAAGETLGDEVQFAIGTGGGGQTGGTIVAIASSRHLSMALTAPRYEPLPPFVP